jgi:stage II sporulation protein AA (anti-sigma F factor antagonist)
VDDIRKRIVKEREGGRTPSFSFVGMPRISCCFVEMQEKLPLQANTPCKSQRERRVIRLSLQVQTEGIGSTLVVRLQGELDHHTAEIVRERVEKELNKGLATHLIMNLDGLSFMDSSGLGVILGRYKRVSQMGGRMALCSVSDPLMRLFELSGIQKILRIYRSESEALEEMGEVKL